MISGLRLQRGVTFIELLIVLCLMAVLMTLFFPVYDTLKDKARDAACINNLRRLQQGVAEYMLESQDVWPQPPELNLGESEEPLWEWWYNELKDYGVSKRHWVCPSEVSSREHQDSTTEQFFASYIPTSFDATPRIALMWGTQPWFIERGQFHGDNHGPNIAMPDGSIKQGPAVFGMQQ